MSITVTRDYYCSQKFDWLEIRTYDGFVQSCCKADPDRLTVESLKTDPAAFFNWPKIVEERQMMLENRRVPGCESCWYHEDRGLPSRRVDYLQPRYDQTRQTPKTINLVISNTCNLTCVYCCKNFSHSWARDIIENGPYELNDYQDRYEITDRDRLLFKMSQKDLDKSKVGDLVLDQIQSNTQGIEKIMITGGEPLLYNSLIEILQSFKGIKVSVYTGLGVSKSRLSNMISKMKDLDIDLVISAENTGRFHEFNRYGSKYSDFLENLQVVKEHFPTSFASSISNLTVIDWDRFLELNRESEIYVNPLVDPDFLRVNMLDDETKLRITKRLEKLNDPRNENILELLSEPADPILKPRLKSFLQRFLKSRQDINLDIFPDSFKSWLST